MNAHRNPLNVRFEGEALRVQLELESALADNIRFADIVRAIDAGADPRAYPMAELKDRWLIERDANPVFSRGHIVTPDCSTLLGHVLMTTTPSLMSIVERTFKELVLPKPDLPRWSHVPPAYADRFGEDVSVLELMFSYEHYRQMIHCSNNPTAPQIKTLLERLDTRSVHMRHELASAARDALARSLDSVPHRHRAIEDERVFDAYNAFGQLVLAGAALNEDDLKKTIRCKIGSSHAHVSLVMAASLPPPDEVVETSPCTWKPIDLLSRLIELGADVNVKGANMRTPLMLAAEHGQIDTVALLLANGADANARDARNWTASSYAKQCKASEGAAIFALLQANEARKSISSVLEMVKAGRARP